MKEYKMKCVILETLVGKTSIIQHFLTGYFDNRATPPGVSFCIKTIC